MPMLINPFVSLRLSSRALQLQMSANALRKSRVFLVAAAVSSTLPSAPRAQLKEATPSQLKEPAPAPPKEPALQQSTAPPPQQLTNDIQIHFPTKIISVNPWLDSVDSRRPRRLATSSSKEIRGAWPERQARSSDQHPCLSRNILYYQMGQS